MMTTYRETEDRNLGYSDGLNGRQKWKFHAMSKRAYDVGYQDGLAIRAARMGELADTSPGWPVTSVKPRLMEPGDLAEPSHPCNGFLRDQFLRRMKADAYYFLQVAMATDQLSLPGDFYAAVSREILGVEKQVKVITGIDLANGPDQTAVRRVGKSAVLSMGYGEGQRQENLRKSRLAEALAKRDPCDQCNGTGRTPIGSDWQEEECALCNGTGKEHKI